MSDATSQQNPQTLDRNGDKRDGYVFISYKREEIALAGKIRAALRESNFEVWWDEDIQCGQVWNEVLDDAVKRAGCIVVLWSPRSMQSRWVMHEASSAIDRGVYAPVRIELCLIEAPYNRLQATDILEWDGSSQHPGVLDLLQRVNELLPARKALHVLAMQWCWSNSATIVSVLFAISALGILIWQAAVTQLQMSRMDTVVAQQSESAGRLNDVVVEQRKASQELLLQTGRQLYPLEIQTASIYFTIPFDDKSLESYISQLSDDPVLRSKRIDIRTLPKPVPEERLARALLDEYNVSILVYSRPVEVARIFDGRILPAPDFECDFLTSPSLDQQNGMHIMFFDKESTMVRWRGINMHPVRPPEKATGKVISIPDLKGCQLLLRISPMLDGGKLAEQEWKSIEESIDPGDREKEANKYFSLIPESIENELQTGFQAITSEIDLIGTSLELAGGRSFGFSAKDCKKTVDQDGKVYFIFNFPDEADVFDRLLHSSAFDIRPGDGG